MRTFSFLLASSLIAGAPIAAAPPAHADQTVAAMPCGNYSVFGRVIAPNAVAVKGFGCLRDGKPLHIRDWQIGTCPVASLYRPDMKQQINVAGMFVDCKYTVRVGVALADASQAEHMQPGRLVKLSGDFTLAWGARGLYLIATDARVADAPPA